jgi:DNA-binding transcriptional ArsR family regulator
MPYERARSRAHKKIFDALAESGGEGFTALLRSTGFSRSTLSRYLKELMREGKVTKIYDREKDEVHYVLTPHLVEGDKKMAGLLFNIDSRYLFRDVMVGAVDRSLPDEDFLKHLYEKIGVLITYTLSQGLSLGDYETAKKWITTAINTESWLPLWISILAWRLYYRRVLPSFAVEALREDKDLMGVGKRFEEMTRALERLQPKDVDFLNRVFKDVEHLITGHKEKIKCPTCGFESEYNIREKEVHCKKCGELFWKREIVTKEIKHKEES